MMRYILEAIIVLLAASTIFAQTGNTAADYGIQAGTELAQAIADKNFASTMGKLATKVSPYLGMVGPVIGLLFSTLGIRQNSAELSYMRRMFTQIETRFDQINQKLDDIARKIDWNGVRCHFSRYESKIKSLQIPLDRFYQARNNVSLYTFRNAFVRRYEIEYSESTQMLFDNIISGGSIFSGNLLVEVIRATDYDRKKTQEFMLGLTKLILVGSQIEMAYYKFTRPTLLANHQDLWTRQMNRMRQALQAADREVANYYDTGATKVAKEIIDNNQGETNRALAGKIFEEVSRRFYWRNWFIAVYDPVRGSEPHWISVCGGDYVFRYHGYNLLLASNSKDTSSLDRSDALALLRDAPITKSTWWNTSLMPAKDIFYALYPKIDTCSSYSAFGVIRLNANFYAKGDWHRLVTYRKDRLFGSRKTFRRGYTFFLFQ